MTRRVGTTLTDAEYQGLRAVAAKHHVPISAVLRAGARIMSADNGESEFMFGPSDGERKEQEQ